MTRIDLFYEEKRFQTEHVVVRLIPMDECRYPGKQKAESMNGL